ADSPRGLLRRHVQGFVQIAAIIDTTGHAEPASLEVLSTPDSGLVEPVKQMMMASRFSPGRLKRAAVRVMVQMAVDVRPPRLSATELVSSARSQLAANRPDSALAELALALDTALTRPTEGERVYALLVRGVAASRTGRDSAGRADLAEGLALYQTLTARGDRKSTRLNSSHVSRSYAVFCVKKKKREKRISLLSYRESRLTGKHLYNNKGRIY